uniref:competence protein ComK n=1 Tax=Candidatus Ventrenecus sp. TaxID=3085654 RepID=UPI003FED66E7
MKNYEINADTLALIPINNNTVKVYEEDEEFLVNKNVNQIMEDSCKYFGSSLEGRKKGTEAMIGLNYKAPIIVEETNELIFFPMNSSRYHDTPWISLKHIKKYYKSEEGIVIEFLNDKKIILNISFGVLDNQVLRATRLESALRGRKIRKNRLKKPEDML